MRSSASALITRDLRLLWQRRGDALQPALFALLTVVLFALALGGDDAFVDARIFGKPVTRPYRRMAVALARVSSGDTDAARKIAVAAAEKITINYGPET